MPIRAALHAETCARVRNGECDCTPQDVILPLIRDSEELAAITGGVLARLQIVGAVEPPVDWTRKRIDPARSQSGRHRAISD